MTENEMKRMQEEALRRTQEMQRRAASVRFEPDGSVRPSSQSAAQRGMAAAGTRKNEAANATGGEEADNSAGSDTGATHNEAAHNSSSASQHGTGYDDAAVGRKRSFSAEEAPPAHDAFQSARKSAEYREKSDAGAAGGIFDTLFKDKEKTLILGLILLLMDEKTDNALLMALIYLLI